jgi:tRNA(Arg) A34 adenosine deaminase TadA
MRIALDEARGAADRGEVPVGAALVAFPDGEPGGLLLARAGNRTRELCDASAHAEILALREAERAAGDFRLDHLGHVACVSTIEPCLMCLGALAHARIRRVVFGVRDEKFGGLFGRFGLQEHPFFADWEVSEGVLAEESAALLREFFKGKRP